MTINFRSIREKVELIKSMELGGVAVWSIEADDFRGECGQSYPLLKTINEAFQNKNISLTPIVHKSSASSSAARNLPFAFFIVYIFCFFFSTF